MPDSPLKPRFLKGHDETPEEMVEKLTKLPLVAIADQMMGMRDALHAANSGYSGALWSLECAIQDLKNTEDWDDVVTIITAMERRVKLLLKGKEL